MSSTPLIYVALGDSTAVGVGASEGGYPARIARRLERRGPVKLINLGESGATSAGVAGNQAGRVRALQPGLVTLAVGVNDLWRQVSRVQFEANLKTIAQALGALPAQVFVNNLPDMSHAPIAQMATNYLGISRETLAAHINEYNQAFRVFESHSNITVVDTHSLSRGELPERRDLFAADGFHPSDAGYEQWARLLWREMNRVGLDRKKAG